MKQNENIHTNRKNFSRLLDRLLDLAVAVAGSACSVCGPAGLLRMPDTELLPLCTGHWLRYYTYHWSSCGSHASPTAYD